MQPSPLVYSLACNEVCEINLLIISEDPELSFHGNKISINLILLPLKSAKHGVRCISSHFSKW